MLKNIILFFSFILSFSVFGMSEKNKIIVSQKQPVFTIKLKSNPTTGFSWQLKSYDKNLVTFLSHRFIAPQNKKLMGAPGVDEFVFRVNKGNYRVNQVGHIQLEYKRPWEKQAGNTLNFIVIVKK